MTTTQTDRDGIPLKGDGVDSSGRLHPHCAADRLRSSFEHERESGDSGPNTWKIAEAVVDRWMEADPRVVGRAAADFLALSVFERGYDEPRVAMRNVQEGDIVRLHGAAYYVHEVIDNAENRGPERSITLKVRRRASDPETQTTYAYSSYVTIPLLARAVPEAIATVAS